MTLHISQNIKSFALLISLGILLSCSKKDEPITQHQKKTAIEGSVEKGPFVRGSIVTINELNSELNPTGRSFKSEIIDDKGSFSLTDIELASNYVQVSVNGYYFNEITGTLSASQITLNAIADITTNKSVNVNVLSHLEEKRVRTLIKNENKSFTEAKKQALAEIYTSFFVKTAPTTRSELFSLTKNDENSNILLGISASLLNISQSNNAKLTELLSIISGDLEKDGELEAPLKQAVKQGLETLNVKSISNHLKNRYKVLNLTLADFSIDKVFFVEVIGDNVLNENTFSTAQDFRAVYSHLFEETSKAMEEYFKLEGLFSKTVTSLPQNDFYLHRVNPDNPHIATLFSGLYKSIRVANMIIDHASKTTSMSSYKYKAYPFFAYNYWILMNLWGDVPYLHPGNYKNNLSPLPRTKKNEIAQLLISRLDETIQNLSSNDMESNLAKAIAARIAADNGEYALAKKYLDQVIDSKRYQLASKSEIHTQANESILGFNYAMFSPENKPNDYDLYAKGNYRSLFRYTEVLLLAAEMNLKLNHKEEAISLLNQVRLRNGKTTIPSNENEVLVLLQEEIKADLYNEGVLFAFLKRNNLAESSLGILNFQKLMPIPIMEMALNIYLQQNPGY